MMHFPSLFQISPYFRKIFRFRGKFAKFFLFPEKFFDFHPPKFLMTFFSHPPEILKFPSVFLVSVHFPPVFQQLLFSPLTFKNFPRCFRKITCFLHTCTFCVFRFPPTLTMMHLCITQCTYWTPVDMQTSSVMCQRNYSENKYT